LSKAVRQGREEAVCQRPFTKGRRRPFMEGGRRPFIKAGGNIHQETWLFIVVVGRKNNELLHWEIQDSTWLHDVGV